MFNTKNKTSEDICNKYLEEYKKDINKNKLNLKYELNYQITHNTVLGKQAIECLEKKAKDYKVLDLEYLSLMLKLTQINEQYQNSIKEFIKNNC